MPDLITNTSVTLAGWSVASPHYSGGTFNPVTGTFTAPASGTYHLTASCNVGLTAPQSVSMGAGVNPALVLRRTSPAVTDLAVGRVPILDVNIALVLTMRTLVQGPVALDTTLELTAGDVVELSYQAAGSTLNTVLRNCQFAATQAG